MLDIDPLAQDPVTKLKYQELLFENLNGRYRRQVMDLPLSTTPPLKVKLPLARGLSIAVALCFEET